MVRRRVAVGDRVFVVHSRVVTRCGYGVDFEVARAAALAEAGKGDFSEGDEYILLFKHHPDLSRFSRVLDKLETVVCRIYGAVNTFNLSESGVATVFGFYDIKYIFDRFRSIVGRRYLYNRVHKHVRVGCERKLFFKEYDFSGTESYRVTKKKVVHTGEYAVTDGYDEWSDCSNSAPFLARRRTHVLLELDSHLSWVLLDDVVTVGDLAVAARLADTDNYTYLNRLRGAVKESFDVEACVS